MAAVSQTKAAWKYAPQSVMSDPYIVHMVFGAQPVSIFVKMPGTDPFEVQVVTTSTIAMLKRKICDVQGLEWDNDSHIEFVGNRLGNLQIVEDCHICNGSTVAFVNADQL